MVDDDEADKVVEEVAAKPSTNLVSILHSDLKNFTHDRGQWSTEAFGLILLLFGLVSPAFKPFWHIFPIPLLP